MMCTKCGGKTVVLATRNPWKPGKGSEVKRGNDVVGWYTPDFVVRRRECRKCSKRVLTVEVLLDDAVSMVQESAVGHAPTELVQRKQ